ncbi:putative F-box/kelch-repeat protein At2g29780 isoform X2 [Capsella rubella]|uniref:putative F-box/kelch-repeat protein At2g29780 isoform X2 n=1 Tax=Capsella rubella TaxID=81985 RepID=UPI000CD5B4D4|nr:putative F-box/kelch-repeat protein At2g29780 isoform X2 [Capsella rubella]
MAIISETSEDGSIGGDPSKKPEELHKNPTEEDEEDEEENQNKNPNEEDVQEEEVENRAPVLYALIGFPLNNFPSWYILNLERGLSEVGSLPPMNPGSAVVTIGYNMYVMGGWIGLNHPVSTVFVIDCRLHTCGYLPRMKRPRYRAAAGVVDGKIYVIGGREKGYDEDWIEVFDVEKRTWSSVPDPSDCNSSLPGGGFVTSVVMQDRIYILDAVRGLVYEPRQGIWQSWESGTTLMELWRNKSCCVIDDMLYSFDPWCVLKHPIVVFDPDEMVWSPVKDTWCIEITLEKREGGEIWGKVDSQKRVLSSVNAPHIDFCCSVTF